MTKSCAPWAAKTQPVGALLLFIGASLSRDIDLLPAHVHIPLMDFDISRLLENWEYEPGQVVVRRFKAKDGTEKIQLRVDLGLLQMNA